MPRNPWFGNGLVSYLLFLEGHKKGNQIGLGYFLLLSMCSILDEPWSGPSMVPIKSSQAPYQFVILRAGYVNCTNYVYIYIGCSGVNGLQLGYELVS